MSTSDQSGAAQLAKQIGDLYLNKSFSDVTIVVDGTELPAHRVILSQRCLYFRNMMIETTSKQIELRDTPIDSFKLVLKWIYTGEIEFNQKETVEEVQRLSNMFLLTELKTVSMKCVERFKLKSHGTFLKICGIVQLANQIGHLYLDTSFSDVTIVIDDTELPAHRTVLLQRCPYFETTFATDMIESKQIELRETPINGFRSVLKWIYTGEIEFSQMDNALEVLLLSKMYELVELEKLAGEYVRKNCKVGNVFLVLNNIALFPEHQQYWIDNRLEDIGDAFLVHETFSTLSKDGLSTLLKSQLVHITNAEMLEAFVRWMKANPDKSEHFRDLLKQISLNSISLGELVSIVPSDLISGNMLIEAAREQQAMYENGRVINTNFAVLKYGAKINVAGKNLFFPTRFLHEINDETREVVIDLGQRFKVNTFYAQRPKVMQYPENSHIEISVSTNEANWTCVVDRRSLDDYYCKQYSFEERLVRFIRISGDRHLILILKLDLFKVCYE